MAFTLRTPAVAASRARLSAVQVVAKTSSGRSTVSGRKTASGKAPKQAAVAAEAGTWFPGAEIPEWLPASIPANRGFDPLGLGKEPKNLERFQEAEVFHARIALLGALGVVSVEALGYGNWYDATLWASTPGGHATYLGGVNPLSVPALLSIAIASFAFAETTRGAETDAEKRKYPGGSFDFLNTMADPETAEVLKTKELKNGRLAMVSCLGFWAQHAATGKGPLAALSEHLANPTAANFTTNGVSLPA